MKLWFLHSFFLQAWWNANHHKVQTHTCCIMGLLKHRLPSQAADKNICSALLSTAIATVERWYCTRRPMHCDHVCSIVSSNRSWFINDSCLVAADTPSSKSGRNLARNGREFSTKCLFHNPQGSLTCHKRHGADGFTSPPKEVVLLMYCPKNVLSSVGFEPADLESNEKRDNH
jgi:hypothetical protein